MKILLVEDELAQRQILETELRKLGYEITGVASGSEAITQIEADEFDIAVTDLQLPDFDGIEIIRRVRDSGNDIPILVITAFASLETAIAALQAGATDYLIKPIRVPDLARRLRQIDDLDRLSRENQLLWRLMQQDPKSYWFPETVAGANVRRLVSKVGSTDLTVLVSGESGTGKGMTARLLHSISPRAEGSFVSVNCAAIPDSLMEAELFGFTKGAFKGATRSRQGLFAAASGGTLFLDEVGSLSLPMQTKLLHCIEEKSIRPIGSARDVPVDLRLIVATNRDLEKRVAEGGFREDLLFRLNVFQIRLPALREQREAIPSAVEYFLAKHSAQRPGTEVRIASAVWDRFSTYPWPGNLRELENTIERALVLCEGEKITLADLPQALQIGAVSRPVTDEGTLKQRVEAFERLTILQTLEMVGGDRRRAAELLGVGLSTIYRKLDDGTRSG
jgi:two-component system response regulator AtoC